MTTVAQIVGIVLLTLGLWMLWSPWGLIVGGGLLLVAPELAGLRRRRP